MKYYSTNKKSPLVDFKEATIRGQAPDKGLYFPELIPRLKKEIIENISSWPDEQIAFEIIKSFTGKTIGENELMNIVKETVNFPIPLVPVTDQLQVIFKKPCNEPTDITPLFNGIFQQYLVTQYLPRI